MNQPDENYFALRIDLEYRYSLGALKPYFDALKRGIALASNCSRCGTAHFPPRLGCCGEAGDVQFVELSGLGVVVETTQGRQSTGDTAFALIAMDGASNCALGRLAYKNASKGDRVKLGTAGGQPRHPAQHAIFDQAT